MKPSRRRCRTSFTLVEMLLVIAVIGLLTTFATVGVRRAMLHSKIEIARQDLERLAAAIEQLAWDTGRWPGTSSTGSDQNRIEKPPSTINLEVWVLSTDYAGLLNNAQNRFSNWKGPYIDRIPRDPWGMDYFFDPDYRIETGGDMLPVVGSFGPDRRGPNRYDDNDIVINLNYIYERTQ